VRNAYNAPMPESTRPEWEAKAEAWVNDFCVNQGITWDKLTPGQQFSVLRAVPCTVRCARIGEPVEVAPGEDCPECGKPHPPLLTQWERLLKEDA
jgi:hypothetical protein